MSGSGTNDRLYEMLVSLGSKKKGVILHINTAQSFLLLLADLLTKRLFYRSIPVVTVFVFQQGHTEYWEFTILTCI